MTNAYTGNPSTVPADKVRLLIGDTETVGILTDLEIADFLADAKNDTLLAAMFACDSLIAQYAYKVTKKVSSEQSVNWSDLVDHFEKLAIRLKKRYETGGYEIPSIATDTEATESRFTTGKFSNT